MGARLLTRAYLAAAEQQLGHAPTRLLVYMAFRALDDATPPVSFIGRDLAAEVLGNRGTTAQKYDAVKKVTATLKRAGLIILRNQPQIGRRAEYILNLPHRGETTSPLFRKEGGTDVPRGGKPDPQEGGTEIPPKEYLMTTTEDEGGATAPASPFCKRHPDGTDAACNGCKAAAIAYFGTSKPSKVQQNLAEYRRIFGECPEGEHRWMHDGTCNFCAARQHKELTF